MKRASVVVLHAYSRSNRGDGYLVDLTLRQLERHGVDREGISVVASDAASFAELPHVLSVPFGAAPRRVRNIPAYVRLATRTLRSRNADADAWREVIGAVEDAELVVGVGGGYLRGGTMLAAAKASLVHLPQLLIAARSDARTVYLPQSIGPFRWPVRAIVEEQLSRLDYVFARDDRTLSELRRLPNVTRVPDLAALELAEEPPVPVTGGAGVLFVGRSLPHGGEYLRRVRLLLEQTKATIALQSVGRGNDDLSFYRRLGIADEILSLSDSIRHVTPAVAIAVRLHAALEAIRLGVPTIHLSYERKGWAAFRDLGLDSYVHSAYHFDPRHIAEQAATLANDAHDYWERVTVALPRLRLSQAPLDDALAVGAAAVSQGAVRAVAS